MYQDILVPVDFSDESTRAIETALELVGPEGGRITLLHVIESLDLPFEEVEDFYRRLEGDAREKMASLAESVREAGVPLVEHVRYGKRVGEIVEHAQEQGADLIVMTSHRLGPDQPEGGWMTISHQVAIFAPCPVLLLR